MRPILIIALLFLFSCTSQGEKESYHSASNISYSAPYIPYSAQNAELLLDLYFAENQELIENGFDFPVGKPNANGYYNAQGFGKNTHLGDDWNGVGGGNTDLGDPVYTIANGLVVGARDEGMGWGNVIRVVHKMRDAHPSRYILSLYAHLEEMHVESGQKVEKGTQIGTIGNADGAYWAHLHLEIRDSIWMPLGGGYDDDTTGFVDPTDFINKY